MTGTECVIAEGPDGGPAKYDITSYKKSGIDAMAAQTLADTATMVEADAYVVAFTKLIDEPGEQTVGADRFVWSYGSGSLGFHGGDVGALTLDLETCAFSVKKIETVSSRKIKAHGGLLLAAFAALMPSALVAAKSRFVLAPGPLWIRIHIACNVAALILALAGVAVAAAAIDGTDGADHLRGRHPKIGVGVMVVVGAMTSLLVACFCAWLAVAVAGAAKRHKTPPTPLAPHRPSDSEIALKEVNTPINEREAAP
ncbi:succinate transmembrane transporter [Aureococcus anophagefferens]|nr:succinate transmembrane transporter [Aureococcus anophagefferens]